MNIQGNTMILNLNINSVLYYFFAGAPVVIILSTLYTGCSKEYTIYFKFKAN